MNFSCGDRTTSSPPPVTGGMVGISTSPITGGVAGSSVVGLVTSIPGVSVTISSSGTSGLFAPDAYRDELQKIFKRKNKVIKK